MTDSSLEMRLESYKRLLTLSQVIASTLDLVTLLDLIVNAARELTNTEATSILLVDNKTGQLYFEAASGSKGEEIKRVVVPPDSVAGWVVREGRPQIISDVSKDQRFFAQSDQLTGFRTRSLIAVPLKVKDRVIGALEALNRIDDSRFTEEDIDVLTTLSAQAAVAIENARLFQQSDLISEMVHELRSPLTSIVAYSELLLNRAVSPEQVRAFVGTIFEEANQLSHMTNDFLELSRLQSGRTRLQIGTFDIEPLIDEVINLLQPQADERGLALSRQLPDRMLPLIGDKDRIRQVLVNLTSNAIKYNRPQGSVVIQLEPLNDAKQARISVKDTGRGIPEKDLPRIFDKFYRVADAEGWAQGTGLGLSIVKQIVEAHDSRISVESTLDVGTTFSFTLKAVPAIPEP
jgi:signal transduction histidine kinase